MKDHRVFDALTDAFNGDRVGMTGKYFREKYTREEQDKFAFEPQEKAVKAIDSGRFKTDAHPTVQLIGKRSP